jgi:poly(3-hydroxybutyrate) depolymerase
MAFMFRPRAVAWLATALALGCTNSFQLKGVAVGGVVTRGMVSDGVQYSFVVYVPTTYVATKPLPALLLVHGAGGNGPQFLEYWRAFAELKGIILIAPTLDLSAAAETTVPVVFPRIMSTVEQEWSVDASQRYLFGYSAGGYFVYDAALLSANYFAGGAIYAAVIQPEYDWIVRDAQRATSIAIYLGDHDQFFSVQQGRRTRDLLLAAGMNVHYVELADHDHEYGSVADSINADAWTFLTSTGRRP